MPRPPSYPHLVFAAVLTALVVLGACSSDLPSNATESTSGGGSANPTGSTCLTPQEGCPCSTANEKVACGKVTNHYGDFVICSEGTRTCTGGRWGSCIGTEITTQSVLGGGINLQDVGNNTPVVCTNGADPCDPYCSTLADDPSSGFTPPAGFSEVEAGLTLTGTVGDAGAACSSLTVTPSATTYTVTNLSSPGSMTFTAALSPAGCGGLTSPYATVWSVGRPDQASMTVVAGTANTNNTNGTLTFGTALPGTYRVTAYAGGVSGYVDVPEIIDVVQTSVTADGGQAGNPNLALPTGNAAATLLTQLQAFYGGVTSLLTPPTGTSPLVAPTLASTATWLYPYTSTFFPLGLAPPVVMYKYNTTPVLSAVKVSLRYPAGVAEKAAGMTFNYSILVTEPIPDPRVFLPTTAWQRFEQTARGNDATIAIQRFAGGVLEQETQRTIHFVDGQLKGTVYYNSYSSPQGGNTGAVLSIAPGALSPTLAVQPSGKCTVCHSLNLDGSRLIANGEGLGDTFNESQRFNMTAGSPPSPTALSTYTTPVSMGDRYTYGAPWIDGSRYLTYGSDTTQGGDGNWRVPGVASTMCDPVANTCALPLGWGSKMQAITPHFSIDGTMLAFAFWGGATSTVATSPTGSLGPDVNGKRLVVADFKCGGTACTSGFTTTSATVSNARDLTASTTYTTSNALDGNASINKAVFPSFLSDGTAVVFERQITASNHYIAWSPSAINTVAGAQADLWISNVTANNTIAAAPTKLNLLNGLDSTGVNALNFTSRNVLPPIDYHSGAKSFTFKQADNCGIQGTVGNGTEPKVYDSQLNYIPSLSPTIAGGKHWVVFTSRRMYGNIGYANPWDAEPNQPCTSGVPPAKKLWIAAIDSSWTGGPDPSHPAFYLPGQELAAGNSHGYWVSAACTTANNTCNTTDDCCSGLSCNYTSATTKSCVAPPTACVAAGGTCQTAGSPGDCCSGLTCPGAGGTCFDPLTVHTTSYSSQTLTRDFIASCPPSTGVKWRLFEWQATIPGTDGGTGPSIQFSAQTRADADAGTAWLPSTPVAVGTASTSTPVTSPVTWSHGSTTVEDAFTASVPVVTSQTLLRITMVFNPSSDNTVAPILTTWQQLYDCVPDE